jgi:hypothetical protein
MLKMMWAGPNPANPGSCRNAEVMSRYSSPAATPTTCPCNAGSRAAPTMSR